MVFSEQWFRQNQWWLLPYVSHDRDNLFIGTNKPLVEIAPDHVSWLEEPGLVTTEFHVHHVYGRRLYQRLSPLWNLMHRIDMSSWARGANLNFGFDTLTAYPDAHTETDTVDGYVGRDVAAEAWSTMRAGAGTTVSTLDVFAYNYYVTQGNSSGTTWKTNYRGVFLFKTSSIGAGKAVSAATLSQWGNTNSESMTGTPTISAVVVSSNPASATTLVEADYGTLGASALSDMIAYPNMLTTEYTAMTLNSAGREAIAMTGITKLGVTCDWDLTDTSPGDRGSTSNYVASAVCSADDTTANNGHDPKLVVTYSAASTFIPKCIFL